MLKPISLFFGLMLPFIAGVSSLNAAVVAVNNTISAADSANFHFADSSTTVRLKDAAGELLPVNSVFRVGFFINYTPALDSTLANASFQSLNDPLSPNRFVPIGVGETGKGNDTTATEQFIRNIGGVSRAITSIAGVTYTAGAANAEVAGGLTRGTKLFVFLVDQTSFSGAPPEWGIFSADSWVIPASGDANLTLAMKEVDTTAEVFRGKLGSLGTAVPEVSTSLLTFSVLGAALLRRRR